MTIQSSFHVVTLLAKDIMNKDVEVVSVNTTVYAIGAIMKERDCGSVLVARGDAIVGIITDRDIVLRFIASSRDALSLTAEDVMSSTILYCYENEGISDLVRNMSLHKIRRLAVLDINRRLVGIVSIGDIALQINPILSGELLEAICRDDSKKLEHNGKIDVRNLAFS